METSSGDVTGDPLGDALAAVVLKLGQSQGQDPYHLHGGCRSTKLCGAADLAGTKSSGHK